MSEDKKPMCAMSVSNVSVAGFDLPAKKWHDALLNKQIYFLFQNAGILEPKITLFACHQNDA
jgi:hypothetical protein